MLPTTSSTNLPMKKLFAFLALAAVGLSGPVSSTAADVQLKVVHWCKSPDGRVGQRVDGCRINETEVDVSAQDPAAQVAFDRVSKAYDAAAHPVVGAQVQAPALPTAQARPTAEETMHYGRMKLLRTLAFMVAGALVFKLLLKRSFVLGAVVGFLVELVLVGAAVMN